MAALRARHLPLKIVSTGQHTDLLKGSPAETDLADSLSLGLRTTGEVIRWPLHATTLLREALLGVEGLRALCEEVMPRKACPVYGTVAAADRIAAHIQQVYVATGRIPQATGARNG